MTFVRKPVSTFRIMLYSAARIDAAAANGTLTPQA
jgi:hypothetical protein